MSFKIMSLCIAFMYMVTITTSTPFLVLNNGSITTNTSTNKTPLRPSTPKTLGGVLENILSGILETPRAGLVATKPDKKPAVKTNFTEDEQDIGVIPEVKTNFTSEDDIGVITDVKTNFILEQGLDEMPEVKTEFTDDRL